MNPKDIIKLDVPLFIRLLEYAREDAKSDMDLHKVAENIIQLSSSGVVLGMQEYQMIVGDHDELNEEFSRMQELAGLNEDKSRKNSFLGIFKPSKDVFQRIIKNLNSSKIESLIQYTKSNGDNVELINGNAWGSSKESMEKNQALWQFLDGDLYFENPNYPSIYDDYIRKNI